VQLCLAHGALEPEQETVVEVRGVVDPVFVQDQRVEQGADLEQPVPIRVVAGEPRDFESEHDAGAPHADFGDELGEAFAVGCRGCRATEVLVDDHDLVLRPAERHGSLA